MTSQIHLPVTYVALPPNDTLSVNLRPSHLPSPPFLILISTLTGSVNLWTTYRPAMMMSPSTRRYLTVTTLWDHSKVNVCRGRTSS